jgi:CrcB protein
MSQRRPANPVGGTSGVLAAATAAPPWRRPDVLAAVGAGGALGACARYAIGLSYPQGTGGFPWATFAINVSGGLLLGALVVLLTERFPPSRYARPFLGTGVLGGYTTFSTYSVETVLLLRAGFVDRAVAYALASVVVALFAAWLGIALGRVIARPRRSR